MKRILAAAALLLFLMPARAKEKEPAAPLAIHPKVFHLVDCWISDSVAPVVTEINLDAVKADDNQFQTDGLKRDGEWLTYSDSETHGFMRYRVIEAKGDHYKIEYQENGGGSLTTASLIEFALEKRDIKKDGKSATIHVLKILAYASKSS